MTTLQKTLHSYLTAELDYWDFSGVIRIIQNDTTLYEVCRGYSSIEFQIKNTMDTRFVAASISKQFTAFAIMILYDKGLLQLHEKANQYPPATM